MRLAGLSSSSPADLQGVALLWIPVPQDYQGFPYKRGRTGTDSESLCLCSAGHLTQVGLQQLLWKGCCMLLDGTWGR